jgi:hypothetical protein
LSRRPAGSAPSVPPTGAGLPLYDRTQLSGFYVAIGTSGNQFKNAPVVGRLMAALIDQVEFGADHDAQPEQYKGVHTGLRIDFAAFPVSANSIAAALAQ